MVHPPGRRLHALGRTQTHSDALGRTRKHLRVSDEQLEPGIHLSVSFCESGAAAAAARVAHTPGPAMFPGPGTGAWNEILSFDEPECI
eukprot:3948946-Prymnesium_polylepis.1